MFRQYLIWSVYLSSIDTMFYTQNRIFCVMCTHYGILGLLALSTYPLLFCTFGWIFKRRQHGEEETKTRGPLSSKAAVTQLLAMGPHKGHLSSLLSKRL